MSAIFNKKFQIFVSSTYKDLIEERDVVFKTVVDLLHIPLGMERFISSAGDKISYIKKQIDQADYFFLILGVRYGEKEKSSGKSYTELEYEYALSQKIPVIAFVMTEEARKESISRNPSIIDGDDTEAFIRFRNRVQADPIVMPWKDRSELAVFCQRALIHHFEFTPRPGWVRFNEVDQILKQNMSEVTSRLALAESSLSATLKEKDDALKEVATLKKKISENSILTDRVVAESMVRKLKIEFDRIDENDCTDEESRNRLYELLSQFEELVLSTKDRPQFVQASMIEEVGDLCRKNGMGGLALWLYEQALERDPGRYSAKVELYSLMTEMVPQRRDEAIEFYRKLDSGTSEYQLKRIFDSLIRADRYSDLEQICSLLLERLGPSGDPNRRVLLLKNRAVARKNIDQFSEEMQRLSEEDMDEALKISPDDENTLSTYAAILLRSKKWREAAIRFKTLIDIDPNDMRYYISLAKALKGLRRFDEIDTVLEVAASNARGHDDLEKIAAARREIGVREVQPLPNLVL
ncbi:DUF4062 domain-containing protein [Azospirillum thermophilum]|uniref:DUF4062 domain-containing protein n=1 Tax=Azospirillum thermophilum TaxID=2202148 RepID=A0A2S2CP22_9PROT|nr:DUF4062 domain-containing protein [Azospirillum thermophilum]AWK86232.1 hypothetical protein DEW08_08195 [Azospirillum thermophilum]